MLFKVRDQNLINIYSFLNNLKSSFVLACYLDISIKCANVLLEVNTTRVNLISDANIIRSHSSVNTTFCSSRQEQAVRRY